VSDVPDQQSIRANVPVSATKMAVSLPGGTNFNAVIGRDVNAQLCEGSVRSKRIS
jgi:hypothetical protein